MHRKQAFPSRRHSLPVPSLLPTVAVGNARSFPEGTETFQKALEDLYISDLSQPFIRSSANGLKEIEEGDEEDYSSDDSEESEQTDSKASSSTEIYLQVPTPPFTSGARMDRRHSLPGRLVDQPSEKDLKTHPQTKQTRTKGGKALMKDHSQSMKDYFIKHGHWPTSNQAHSAHSLKAGQKDLKKVSPRQVNKHSLSSSGKFAHSKT